MPHTDPYHTKSWGETIELGSSLSQKWSFQREEVCVWLLQHPFRLSCRNLWKETSQDRGYIHYLAWVEPSDSGRYALPRVMNIVYSFSKRNAEDALWNSMPLTALFSSFQDEDGIFVTKARSSRIWIVEKFRHSQDDLFAIQAAVSIFWVRTKRSLISNQLGLGKEVRKERKVFTNGLVYSPLRTNKRKTSRINTVSE